MHYSHLIRIKSNFMQVSIITLITYFFSIKIQFAHKTPLNPKRDVNKKALCKTRNPLSVLSDMIRVQFQITLFFCQNLPFIILSAFLVIVTNPKIKKGTTKLWPKQDPRGVTTARYLCVGTNKSKMKARINLVSLNLV